jgi:ribosome-associated heat shock protein Hsp15
MLHEVPLMARGAASRDDDDVEAASPPGKVRLDKWLWAARFFKTRGLAAEAIDGGKVSVNDDRPKRARLIAVGDVVSVRHGAYEHIVAVRDVSARRGSAAIAPLPNSQT